MANSYFGLRDTSAVQNNNSWRASKNEECTLFILIFTGILHNREETKIHILRAFLVALDQFTFAAQGWNAQSTHQN